MTEKQATEIRHLLELIEAEAIVEGSQAIARAAGQALDIVTLALPMRRGGK